MAVSMFEGKLNEELIIDAYTLYLQKHTVSSSNGVKFNTLNSALMAYEEFKEYHVLKLLGRASEFSNNIARDYQYLSIGNWSQPGV